MKKMFAGCVLLGALIFILIYGTAVLDVTGDGWVFKSDNDLRQHYLGWMAFRDTPWTFPLGMTDRLSHPVPMSIVYTDSIPFVALFAKLLSPVLPRPFQYFGLYGMLSFALTAGFAFLCFSRLVKRKSSAVLLALLVLLSYPMLHRTFYHTSLASQWIILLCFYLWFSGADNGSAFRRILIWGGLGVLCVGIHTYFLPMAFAIMCASLLEKCLSAEKPGNAAVVCGPVSMCLGALVMLWCLGAFAISGSGEYWAGDFTMNLNSFFNSMGNSRLLPKLPLWGEMQFEGSAYLGLGVLALTAVCLVLLIRKRGFSLRRHPRRIALLILGAVLVAVAVFPTFAFGDQLLIRIPLSRRMNNLLGIFRSNGRFIWPVIYIIIFSAGRFLERQSARYITLICALALALQAFDYSAWMMKKHDKYGDAQKTYRTVWDEIELPGGYEGFVMFEDDNSFIMGTAYYAMRHDMWLNSFYFARDIDSLLQEEREKNLEDLRSGRADPGKIYVFDRQTYEDMKDCGLFFYRTRKCAFGVAERIEGMEELRPEELDDISWQ